MSVDKDLHQSIPSIQELFKGKCVLITGVTGFVGKVLLEKLVRCCPGVSRILVVIRHNEKWTSYERLVKLLHSTVFDRCTVEIFNIVRVIDGDVTSKNLALKEEDLNRVYSEVNYVFHCAASVRFENDAKSTLKVNFIGVKNMLELCSYITKLEAFVHVSTAYSFCNQTIIEEKIYPEDLKVENLEDSIQWMNNDQLQDFCKIVSMSRPSLYQYSKAMAEIYLSQNCGKLPVIIVRPSIITAAAREPFPGWVDNYNGPSGFIALSSKGILKTLLVKPDVNADWVPVDLVVNTLIVAAHYIAVQRLSSSVNLRPLKCPSNIPIINCVCPSSNSIKWSRVIQICILLLYKYPSLQMYRTPGGIVTSYPVLYMMCKYYFHIFPAAILDTVWLLTGNKTRFVSFYRRIHKVMDHLQLYMVNKFSFSSVNMHHLAETATTENRKVFPIDQNLINWRDYLENYVHGVRKFFLKEDDETLRHAQRKLLKLSILFTCGKLLPIGIVLIYYLQHAKKATLLSMLKSFLNVRSSITEKLLHYK